MDHAAAAIAIVTAGRRLEGAGLIAATEGNLSMRLDDGQLLVTPSGRRKGDLAPADLVLVDLATGAIVDPTAARPTSDLAIHLAVHRARPDIGAIAHAHLPASMALTLASEIPDPAALPETAVFLPRLPFIPFGAMGSEDLAERVAAAFGASRPTAGRRAARAARRTVRRAGPGRGGCPSRARRGAVPDVA
jgi:L-fuculose-phosphate aldolase